MPAGPPEQITPQSLNDYLEIMSKSVFQSGMVSLLGVAKIE
jgi:hypothetical protein